MKVESSLNKTILVNGWLTVDNDAVNNELRYEQSLFVTSWLMFDNEQKTANYNNHKQLLLLTFGLILWVDEYIMVYLHPHVPPFATNDPHRRTSEARTGDVA